MAGERTDPTEREVIAAAERTGEPYELIECDPDFADTAAFCERYGYSLDESANTIVVVGKSDPPVYAACVVLASTRLDVNGTVRQRLGVRKASFAPADDTRELTGQMIGGVTALLLPKGLPLWVDEAVMKQPRVILGGGSRSMKIAMAPAALRSLGAEVVVGLAKWAG